MRTDGGSREDGLTGLAMFHVKHRVVQRYAIHDFCRSISANISFAVKNRSECAARDTRWFAYLLRIVLLHWWVKYIDAG